MLLYKKVPCLRNLRIVCFVTYRNIPAYSCQRSAFMTIAVKCSKFFLCRKGKRFVNVRLHCIVSNLIRISKISMLPPLEKFLQTPMERRPVAILTEVR